MPPGYRVESRPATGLLATGGVTLAASYLAGLVIAQHHRFGEGMGWMAVPLVGPWGAIGARSFQCRVTGTEGRFNAMIKVEGGGVTGQAGAIRHGIARALLEVDADAHRLPLRQAGLLTRDPRMKEPKKYGLKRARKAPQYTNR